MILESVLISLLQLSYNGASQMPENQTLHCIFSRARNLGDWEQLADDTAKAGVNITLGLEQLAPMSAECTDSNSHCIAIWAVRNNQTEMLLQDKFHRDSLLLNYHFGCWDVTEDVCSPTDECSSGDRVLKPLGRRFLSYMCCCRESNCNRIDRVVGGPLNRRGNGNAPSAMNNHPDIRERDFKISTLLWIMSTISVIFLLLTVRKCWTYRVKQRKHQKSTNTSQSLILPQPKEIVTVSLDETDCLQNYVVKCDRETLEEENDPFFESLQLGDQIGAGYFAVIYKARSTIGNVAVKIYRKAQTVLSNEYELLTLLEPFKHPNIVRIVNCSDPDKFLVMELCSRSLHSLLEERPLTLTEFFDCAISITDGLAFLHSHSNNGADKLVVAHRDLNPYNLLVRNRDDFRLQLCIADFGLSIAFFEGRSNKDNIDHLTERGTVRYMAGELIEGSLNLLDPMTSLLQTDVYSCALVLWELLWRCLDIWPRNAPPSHRLPYDDVVPPDPRLEDMYPVVVKDRRRPDMPTLIQKQKSLSNLSNLVELWSFITDMWEHEPDGRTTSACTADRLRHLRKTMDPAGIEVVRYSPATSG